MAKPRKQSTRIAEKITNGMATWSFVISFLLFCLAWMEYTTHAPAQLTFDDKTFIHLNLMLSLMAAVQGSIIMISQKYQDKKRDEILARIDSLEKRHDKDLKELKHDVKKVVTKLGA